MPIELKIKQSSAVLMAALSAAFPLSGQAAGAARVDFATGDVKALAADGRSRALAKGAEVASGETIDTGNGRAQVRFTDGAQVSLQPQTQFRIDDYNFAGKADGSEKGFFSLLKGGLRTITGLVGRSNRDNYKVTTTVATIGIRGTEYSVAYGNSINVTTGEGIVEVCNAAGCLIVNSGETAYVADNTTRPVMTDKKTELPPQPAQDGQLPGFVAGDDTSGSGTPSAFGALGLVSGPGYSLAMVGQFNGSVDARVFPGDYLTTNATISGGGLSKFDATDGSQNFVVTQGSPVGMLDDGTLGWGRWIDGTFDDDGTVKSMQHVHYVFGMPTPAADMSALQIANAVGTYSLSGYTYPTAWDGSTTTIGTQPISGSLTANFGSSSVSGNLTVPMGSNTYTSNWSGTISGTSPSSFFGSGSASSTGGDCFSGCSASIDGFFAGANASHAGLVYQITGAFLTYGNIHGAAAFKKD